MSMASKPKVLSSDEIHDRIQLLYQATTDDADAVCVIVSTSFLESALRGLLRKHFVNGSTAEGLLKPTGGALGALHHATCAAYCMGLISKEFMQNIETVGNIRNQFAHSIDEMTFDDPEVSNWCKSLHVPHRTGVLITEDIAAREKFVEIVCEMCHDLLDLAMISTTHAESPKDRWEPCK